MAPVCRPTWGRGPAVRGGPRLDRRAAVPHTGACSEGRDLNLRLSALLAGGVALALLAACVSPLGTPAQGQAVNDRYTVVRIGWTRGMGAFYLFVGAHGVGGEVAICAAIAVEGQVAYTVGLNRQILGGVTVALEGDRMIQDLAYAQPIPFQGTEFADYVGQPTACRRVSAPWLDAYASAEPEVRVPRMRFN